MGHRCAAGKWNRVISFGSRSAQWKMRSEEHTSELQSRLQLVCRLLLEKKKAERRRREAQNSAALGEAETRWKAQESEKSAAARSEWQQLSARMLAEEADKCRRFETALAAEADKGRKLEAALEALVQARNVPTQAGETHELDRLRN